MAISPESNNSGFELGDDHRISRASTILVAFGLSAVLWAGIAWVISLAWSLI
jgi:hypothetical protein